MPYSREVYETARTRLETLRQLALRENEERKRSFEAINPEYAKLEQGIAQTAISLTRVMLSGQKDITESVAAIRDNNLAMQRRQAEILRENGCPPDYLEPRYHCAKCCDTGFVDGKTCECFKNLLQRAAYEELNRSTPLELCSFRSFSMDYYPDRAESSSLSPRQIMERVKKTCWDYASGFTTQSPNLLFQGGVGLGKTHLSLAIAGKVISKGYGVVYGSAPNFFNAIESEHFGRGEDKQYTLGLLKSCDLLILDDLGTEFVTQFTTAALYDILNTLILRRRPTIISTNFHIDGLKQKYDDRITSRLSGNYLRVQFVGSDVRITLKVKKSGKSAN
ncbi:MAG: ATP-binding protein [Clostridia bacterium]|nr:ATP-binding protein [Clostridia bacterium]